MTQREEEGEHVKPVLKVEYIEITPGRCVSTLLVTGAAMTGDTPRTRQGVREERKSFTRVAPSSTMRSQGSTARNLNRR